MIVPIKLHLTSRGGKKVGFCDSKGLRNRVTQHYFPRIFALNNFFKQQICSKLQTSYLIPGVLITALILTSCDSSESTVDATSTQIPKQLPTSTLSPTPILTPTEVMLQGTVIIWHTWNDENDLEVLFQMIYDFRDIHPEVQFDVLYVPFDDLLSRYEQSVIEGGGPSILIGPDWWGPLLFDSGSIADLSNLVDDAWLESFNQPALELVRYRQNLIGLPYSLRGVVLYRNQTIIPKWAETFDDLINFSKDATAGEILGAVLDRGFYYSGGHLFGLGGQLMDNDYQPIFDDEYGLAWLDLLGLFEQAGPTEFNSDNDINLFMESRVGYLIEGTWERETLAETIGYENLFIDPWPAHGGGQLSGFIQSRNLYLNPNIFDDSYQAVWEFCEFFLSPKYQLQFANLGNIPVLLDFDVADSLTSQTMIALTGGSPYPPVPGIEIYAQVLNDALRSIFFNGVPADLALDQASIKILESLSHTNTE